MCPTCGQPLQGGTVLSAGEGTTLEEYGLSDSSAAQLLAATEILTVRCGQCGVVATIGRSLVQRSEIRSPTADDLRQWRPAAVELCRSIVRVRLSDRVCPACHGSLRDSTVEKAAGGAIFPEFDLDDDAALTAIAWTQCLTVRCVTCGAETKIG
jgi:hypothetical protein